MMKRGLMKRSLAVSVFLFSLLLLANSLLGRGVPQRVDSLPKGRPEDVGLSSDRLQQVHDSIHNHITAGDIPGAVTLVARKGRVVYLEAQGIADPESKKPVQKDSIFWIASMTKPITTVALLMLMEEGKVRVSDPVSRYLPDFKNLNKVRVKKTGTSAPGGSGAAAYDMVPANREITIRDLLTHTSGLLSIGADNDILPDTAPTDKLGDWVAKLPAVPLDFQPGTRWAYSNAAGFDVLARVVEVVSGEPFNQFLKERIFDPLGMKDTIFGAISRPDLASRVAPLVQKSPNGFALQKANPRRDALFGTTYVSGAAGLWTTAEDYFRFAEMLDNGGQLNGKRLLSPNTVELMTSNQVGDLFSTAGGSGLGYRGLGFGFSVAVVTDSIAADLRVPTGSYSWDGVGTTRFWVVPKDKLVMIIMPEIGNATVQRDFENAVMQAVVE